MKFRQLKIIFAILFLCANLSAQLSGEFLGIKLRPELRSIVNEIERKTGEKIHAEFIRQEDFQLGSSFISDEGVPVVLIDSSLEEDERKLEAVIAHELLHLRLRVNDYPTFLFSSSVQTARGRAIDTEQSNVNDLTSIIEHRVFKPEMEKFGLSEVIDLAGDTAKNARLRKGQADDQSDTINYARAILEYQNAANVEAVKKVYEANNWMRSLATGREIADLISQSNLQTPQAVEAVFLKCLLKLYPMPKPTFTFKLTLDPSNKFYRQMIINAVKTGKANRSNAASRRR
jgi:hypothetical protein